MTGDTLPTWKSALLVFNAKFASALTNASDQDRATFKRLSRFYLQAVARELIPDSRTADCLRAIVPGVTGVKILYSEQIKRAHYGNLITCASVWRCPVCAAKITERRRIELQIALAGSKYSVFMVTLTFQHSREDALRDLVQALNLAYRKLKSGRWWQFFQARYSLVGSITGAEVTWGKASGFHPHKHALFFSELSGDDLQADKIREAISDRFGNIMANLGRYVSPVYGVDVKLGDYYAVEYVNKWGLSDELTKAPVKQAGGEDGYTPFDLLRVYAEGEKWAGGVFREYALAMHGVKQLVWSRGLRDLLTLGQEITDQDIADYQDQEAAILARLTLAQWRLILAKEKRGELLEVASSGSVDYLRVYLLAMGINLTDD